MVQRVLLELRVKLAVMGTPFGQIDFCKHVVECHAGGMEQHVLLDLHVTLAVMVIPFGQTNFCKHVAKCHAGAAIRVAWRGQPAKAAATVIIGSSHGLVITVNEVKASQKPKMDLQN